MTRLSGPSPTPSFAGGAISEHRLRNGMRVILIERHLDPVVAVMLWYKVGSRNERGDEAGVSHFLEHMMFKGSARYPKGGVDRVTTSLGGVSNAFTTYDHTAFWFELASDRWEAALEIEADRMSRLTLDPGEFAAEKAVVLEELHMGLDDPWRRLSQDVQEVVFPRHPYRRPVIGYADVLERLEVGAMRDYYERFYHPGNATLVIAGDIRPSAALRKVREHFGSLDAGAPYSSADCFRPPLGEPAGERSVTCYWDDPASRLCIAWPSVPVGTDEDIQLDVVSALLTMGRLSRMYRRLVLEQGLASSIGSNNDTRVEGGAFWIFAECAEGVAPERLQAGIDEEIERLATERVPPAELKRAKSTLAALQSHEGETVSDMAETVGSFAIDGDWRWAVDMTPRRNQVTARAVRECAARFFDHRRRVVGWSLPTPANGRRPVATGRRKDGKRKKGARRR